MTSGYGLGLFPDLKQESRSHGRGILPYQEIRQLVDAGHICAEDAVEESQLQPASIDLRLGEVAYQVRASFLPGTKGRVLESAADLTIQKLDIADGAVLQKGAVYIIPLLESLN